MFYRIALFILTLTLAQPSFALSIEEHFNDPIKEQQAIDIFKQIRCMVCTGESINDSKADLAKDMKILIRNQIKEDKTPEEIVSYLHERYGDAILMNPPFQPNTYILWLAPLLLLTVGAIVITASTRKNKHQK